MKAITPIVFMVTASAAVYGEESLLPGTSTIGASTTSMIDGKPYAFFIRVTDPQPNWSPREKLPTEISKLVRVATDQLALYTPSHDTYVVSAVAIQRLGASNYWYSEVEFLQTKGPNPDIRNRVKIPVLLDGTPIKGEPLKPKTR